VLSPARDTSTHLHYTEAYCAFFFYELATAASALETAISLLKKRVEPASLSLAYTGYGTCKQGLCESMPLWQLTVKLCG